MNWKWIGVGIALLVAVTVLRYQARPQLPQAFAPGPPAAQLIEAAGMGDTAAVRALLDQHVDVNTKNEVFGHTALIVAARQGYADTVRLLIERGADVNAQDKYGTTALQWAEKNGHKDVVRLLKEAGARGTPTPPLRAVRGA
ncbi:MAG: ankyrin repeat domain-containing protein [Thermodesulfobacteriota bacterium]|jgi:ankyrin repeat protein